MGKGSTSTETKIPEWLEEAARANIARGNEVANLGPVPYYGPDVAAFTPMQEASFQNTGQAANAFGMAGGGMSGMEGMPQAQTFAGGVRGYSSAPMYEEALAQLEAKAPGQYAAIRSMFIDPQTGEGGYQPPAPADERLALEYINNGGTQGNMDYGGPNDGHGGGGPSNGGFQGPNQNGDVGYGSGGYTSIGDMYDGGGPGVSGGAYSGGGAVSSLGNAFSGSF
jgi:hypothetical protein